MNRVRRKRCGKGGYSAAFGVGLLVALLLPARFILILVAAALVLTGISLLRC